MKTLNEKLNLLKKKIENKEHITIAIFGLGSVGCYLLDYLVSLADPQLNLVVIGRNKDKMQMDVNIIRTAATIRRQMRSTIQIIGDCDLNDVQSIARALKLAKPDLIVNCSRVYSGLKYGSISWNNLRAYGIWTPLSIRFAKNIMEAYALVSCNAISINTSYSDAVIPWLKSAGKAYFDFGSGNLNHLIPRIKFYIADKYNISNLNYIDVTLSVAHFHDVVISKEGHAEGQDILIDIKYQGNEIDYDKAELLKACSISMPVDQKRNMMNASSNFDIIYSMLSALRENKKVKIHSPGVDGEIGGYPVIIDGVKAIAYIDTSIWSLDEMRSANLDSINKDGVKDVKDGCLFYSSELIDKVHKVFGETLPEKVKWDEIDNVGRFLITKIIEPNIKF